jgi:hypothetical protein
MSTISLFEQTLEWLERMVSESALVEINAAWFIREANIFMTLPLKVAPKEPQDPTEIAMYAFESGLFALQSLARGDVGAAKQTLQTLRQHQEKHGFGSIFHGRLEQLEALISVDPAEKLALWQMGEATWQTHQVIERGLHGLFEVMSQPEMLEKLDEEHSESFTEVKSLLAWSHPFGQVAVLSLAQILSVFAQNPDNFNSLQSKIRSLLERFLNAMSWRRLEVLLNDFEALIKTNSPKHLTTIDLDAIRHLGVSRQDSVAIPVKMSLEEQKLIRTLIADFLTDSRPESEE